MHNMMVKAWVENDVVKDRSICNVANGGGHWYINWIWVDGDYMSIQSGDCLIDKAVNGGIWYKSTNLYVEHKWWEAPYDFKMSAQVKDAMKKHL